MASESKSSADVFKKFNAIDNEKQIARLSWLQLARDKKSFVCPKCTNGLNGGKGDGIRQKLFNGRLFWHCYSCGGHWSNLDVFMAGRGLSSLAEAANLIRFENPSLSKSDWEPPPMDEAKPRIQKNFSELYRWWRYNLQKFIKSQGGKWRGLRFETLFGSGVGYNPQYNSVVFAYDTSTFFWRAVEGDKRGINAGGRRQLYIVSSLKTGGDSFNFFTEAEIDALSLKQAIGGLKVGIGGLDNVGIAATGGIGSSRRVVEELNAKFGDTMDKPKIFWAGDNDTREATNEMIRALRAAGYPSTAFYFADDDVKVDVNDYLRREGDDGLLDFLIAVVDSQWQNLSTALSANWKTSSILDKEEKNERQ